VANKHRWAVTEDVATEPRIDEQAGVIYNVLVLGRGQKNDRKYTDEAMEEAVNSSKYEELQVYIGPHKKSRFAKRSPHDHAGELRNTRFAADGIRGDLHYNRASKGGKLVLEIAKRFPKRFGLSHHADVAGYVKDGVKVITRIVEATVADVVKDPATTESVFEDVEVRETAAEAEGDAAVVETSSAEGRNWSSCMKDLIAAVHDDESLEDDLKLKATKVLMKLKKELNGDGGGDSEDEDGDSEEDDTDDAEEAVDVKTLRKHVDSKFNKLAKLIKSRAAAPAPAPRRKGNVPRSSARSEVTEDATPAPKAKAAAAAAKLPVLKKREEIVDAYSED